MINSFKLLNELFQRIPKKKNFIKSKMNKRDKIILEEVEHRINNEWGDFIKITKYRYDKKKDNIKKKLIIIAHTLVCLMIDYNMDSDYNKYGGAGDEIQEYSPIRARVNNILVRGFQDLQIEINTNSPIERRVNQVVNWTGIALFCWKFLVLYTSISHMMELLNMEIGSTVKKRIVKRQLSDGNIKNTLQLPAPERFQVSNDINFINEQDYDIRPIRLIDILRYPEEFKKDLKESLKIDSEIQVQEFYNKLKNDGWGMIQKEGEKYFGKAQNEFEKIRDIDETRYGDDGWKNWLLKINDWWTGRGFIYIVEDSNTASSRALQDQSREYWRNLQDFTIKQTRTLKDKTNTLVRSTTGDLFNIWDAGWYICATLIFFILKKILVKKIIRERNQNATLRISTRLENTDGFNEAARIRETPAWGVRNIPRITRGVSDPLRGGRRKRRKTRKRRTRRRKSRLKTRRKLRRRKRSRKRRKSRRKRKR